MARTAKTKTKPSLANLTEEATAVDRETAAPGRDLESRSGRVTRGRRVRSARVQTRGAGSQSIRPPPAAAFAVP